MSTLTVSQLRQHLETDLADEALQRHIDDAEAAIVEVAGAETTQSQEYREEIAATALFLGRKASLVTSVTEWTGDESTLLAADDYRLIYGGRALERLATGTNPRHTYAERVIIAYVPSDDAPRRRLATIDLCKLSVRNEGVQSESIGDHSERTDEQESRRREILSRFQRWSPL